MPPQAPSHRTAEELAQLLRTRVLHPAEFAGIANGPHTRGWGTLEAAQLPGDPAELEAFLEQLARKGQVVAGVLPADESHPIRIVIRHEAKPPQIETRAPRRRLRRPTQQRRKVPAPAAPSPNA